MMVTLRWLGLRLQSPPCTAELFQESVAYVSYVSRVVRQLYSNQGVAKTYRAARLAPDLKALPVSQASSPYHLANL